MAFWTMSKDELREELRLTYEDLLKTEDEYRRVTTVVERVRLLENIHNLQKIVSIVFKVLHKRFPEATN